MQPYQPTPIGHRWPFIAIGAAAFAAVMTVGPILATNNINASGSSEAYAANSAGMLAARESAVLEAVAPPATEPLTAVAATADSSPPDAATGSPPDSDASSSTADPVLVDDGSVAIELALLTTDPSDRLDAWWEITVTNNGDEYLWGIYAFLEDVGPVPCSDRQLDKGESTTCRIETTVWAGSQRAEAWVTAWTTLRMVEDETEVAYEVDT